MANCILCESKIGFTNRPTFGQGKLKDGNEVCFSCFKNNGGTQTDFKNKSIEELRDYLNTKNLENQNVNNRLNEIKAQISNLKLSNTASFFGRKEINELPTILDITEVLDNIVQGQYNDGQGVLVSTNKRLIFIDKGLIYGLKVEDFPLNKISSIQYQTGLLFGEITIHTTNNVAKIENVEKSTVRSFAEFVRAKLSQNDEVKSSLVTSEPNILEQLEKLAKLKDNGILSEEEFQEQKKKMLEKL